tara:strand:+ start:269 stop:922 length:654 start_codon:yes stop_codon:yes gene_type:complete
MNYYIYRILVVFIFTLLSGCRISTVEEEIVDFQLRNFNLTQLDNKGVELFRLKSSIANIDNETKDVFAKDVIISLTGMNKLFNNISSDNCLVLKGSNMVLLSNNVKLTSLENKQSFLKADNLVWDINKSKVNLYGNISLNYLRTKLSSNNANYNDSLDKIIFSGLTKYIIYSKSNIVQPVIKLSSDKAIINYKSKQIEFVSTNNQVESLVNLDLDEY